MILYLIHDLQKKSYSHPLVGPDLATVNQSLLQLNPENLSDLSVLVLDTLETLEDLLLLRVVKQHQIQPLKNYKYDDPLWQAEASKRSKAVWARSKKISKKSARSSK